MSIQNISTGDDEPLAVSPQRARRLLDIGNTRLYELLGTGELRSYKDGKSRRIVFASLKEYVARRLAETQPPKAA